MSMLLHCGADQISRDQLGLVETPAPMGPRHHPFPYIDFVNTVDEQLQNIGFRILEEAYGVDQSTTRGGEQKDRFFGLMQLKSNNDVFSLSLGLRAANDQSLARSFVAGRRVFVCDNLCFSGEIQMSTKQTLNVESRIPGLVFDAVQKLPGYWEVEEKRHEAYRNTALAPREGDAAIIEMVRQELVSPRLVPKIVKEWDKPSHPDHETEGHTVWRLEQAVTEAWKPAEDSPRAGFHVAADCGPRVVRFLDEVCGLTVGNLAN